jgi:cullin-associated NEDD8-dissociated protein 1
VEARLGGQFRLKHNNVCGNFFADSQVVGNPAINLDASSAATVKIFDLSNKAKVVDIQYNKVAQDLLLTVPLSQCSQVPQDGHVFGIFDGKYWLHDPRFVVDENSLEKPNNEICSSAPPTFLNEASCVISQTAPCVTSSAPLSVSSTVQLTIATLQQAYKDTGKLMYAVNGLRGPWDPPCKAGTTSRWVVVNVDCTDTTMKDSTRTFLQNLLVEAKTTQSNPYMLDVFMPFAGCDATDANGLYYRIAANGKCYENVHPNHWQVFDFTAWAAQHPGGAPAIEQFALSGEFVLNFPDWHTTDRWTTYSKQLTSIGRFGDTVPAIGDPQPGPIEGGVSLVCGSPFEVANNASLAGSLLAGAFDIVTSESKTTPESRLMEQNLMIWMDVALNSKDQLRQRIAWALSQILVVAPYALESWYTNEVFLTYYDIFVRHAFGNYRDILKEVSYSPAMAEMLSYLNSER